VASGGGYRNLIASYGRLRSTRQLGYPRPYRPLLIGIFWPSAWLVLPWEHGPQIAADDPQQASAAIAAERRALEEIVKSIDADDTEAFYTYTQQDRLSESDARDLARMLLPIYARAGDVASDLPPIEGLPTVEQLLATWRAFGQRAAPLDTGNQGGRLRHQHEAPAIAGMDEGFDPRMILRGASVWMMKDRAGTVGAQGVGPLLRDLLAASATARMHVIGHSFGCRVLLSAICSAPALPRKVDSALLLQPAISHLCFATSVPGSSKPGGYRPALERVAQPIMLTFTNEDKPLHDFFQYALWRPADVGELEIAGSDEPPNRFAALGGYGPRGCAEGECVMLPIKPVGERYPLQAGAPRIYALNGAGVIHGHGDFNTEATWWALYNQVAFDANAG